MRRVPGAVSAAILVVTLGWAPSVAVAPAAATAPTDLTWTGANPIDDSGPGDLWSQGNWTGSPPVSDESLGSVTFPSLGSCSVGVESCYQSNNDVGGLVADALSVDDTDSYSIGGGSIGLGSGGLTAAPGGAVVVGLGTADVGVPLVLAANQSWSLTGNGSADDSGVFLQGGVTGDRYTVDAHLAGAVGVSLGDIETGAFTATGATSTDTGLNAADNGVIYPTSLNATDRHPVTVNDVDLQAYSPTGTSVGLGPLTASGALVEIGRGSTPDTIVSVSGAVALGAGTVTQFRVDQSGSIPSTDYAQLKATGNVSLGGSLSFWQGGSGSCVGVGSAETLITTTGTVSGQFTNAPSGAIVPLSCSGSPTGARISYSGHAVTATIVSGSTTATSLGVSRTRATAKQPVTLTAHVTTGTPSFTAPKTSDSVRFLDGSHPVPGCAARPLTATSANAGSATCTAKLPARPSPASLTAVFVPSGSTLNGSTSPRVRVAIAPTATAHLGRVTTSGSTADAPVRCVGSGRCTVKLALTATENKKRVALGTKTTRIAAGHHKTVTITLDHAGKRLLKTHHKLSARLTLTGTPKQITKTIEFKDT
jgi:hypothetical protein